MSTLKQQLKASIKQTPRSNTRKKIDVASQPFAANRKPLAIEIQLGMRATFIVNYTRNGKPFRDGLFSKTEADARKHFLASCKEIGWRNVEITSIVKG